MTTFLSDTTVTLRAVEHGDIDTILCWENDTSLWYAGATVAPYSRKMLEDYVDNYTADVYTARQLRMMIVRNSDNKTVGMVDLYDFDPHNRRAAIGILVDPEARRDKIGTHAITLLSDYARRMLGVHQLWATTAIDNVAALNMFKGCGFSICGRLRSWLRRGNAYQDIYVLQQLYNNN